MTTTIERQTATFQIGEESFGIDVLDVQEVIKIQPMTRVPLAPRAIRGLINLRGQVIPAIDLRHRLGLPPFEHPEEQMMVVVESKDGLASLIVDSVGDVLELSQQFVEPPPEHLRKELGDLCRGVYKLESELMLLLNTERAVEESEV